MAIRLFLALNALVWLPYGIQCFLDPSLLAATAGVTGTSGTGTTELRAMYGGLQAAIGVWAAFGAWKPEAARGVLTALFVLPAGLASTRLTGALMAGDTSAYTLGALAFEIFLTAAAGWLLRGLRAGEERA